MKTTTLLLLVAFAITQDAFGAGVYKCGGAGDTSYGDYPCGPDAERLNFNVRPSGGIIGITPGEKRLLKKRERELREFERARNDSVRELERSVARERLAQQREVAVGMDMILVRRAWGEPNEIVRGIDERGPWERWVYAAEGRRRGGDSTERRVRFRNDLVDSVSAR